MAGEDGDFDAKVTVLEELDRQLPRLLALEPTVVAVTGDHSTPVPMRGHSWHPVPLLVAAPTAFADAAERFDELAAIGGHLGTFPSRDLLAVLLAHAGRLAKYGA
jgi:2,3-bisphosphoglycerate-independent phosphoglycerate mutase